MSVQKYKILSYSSKYILCNNALRNPGLCIRTGSKNELDVSRFHGYIDDSLELRKLEQVFKAHKGELNEKKFVTKVQDSQVVTALINVSFDHVVKTYNKHKTKCGYVYILLGHTIDPKSDLVNHLCIRADENGNKVVAAVEVPYIKGKEKEPKLGKDAYPALCSDFVRPPKENDLYEVVEKDGEYYYWVTEKGKSFATEYTKAEARETLYKDGFYCDGIHYVRYKRSAGSSRQGKCLFIAEPLLADMKQWSDCGLDVSKIKDITSYEAYSALTLSTMKKEVRIPKSAILFVRDAKSTFCDNVIEVTSDKEHPGKIVANKNEKAKIENTIWDGEALLDKSVFEEAGLFNPKGTPKGMMLLRNQFFKTCAFNTNLQLFFADHNITDVQQLNGYTKAKSIEEIKMVVTDSSLKYLKMDMPEGFSKTGYDKQFKASIDKWLENIDDTFGVVKVDEPTGYFDGNMVRTSYQMLNTINIPENKVEELLAPSFSYLEYILKDPMFLRHYIGLTLKEKYERSPDVPDFEDDQDNNEDGKNEVVVDKGILNYRTQVIVDMLGKRDDFAKSRFYADFRKDSTDAFKKRLRLGKLLVRGTYATLFGNGPELLCATIDKDYDFRNPQAFALRGSEIYNKRFSVGETVLGVRSPHITMGNLYLGTNTESEILTRYFNLSNEIVCVNAIENNIQQRLNGCDYDSDTMLLTNDRLLVDASKNYYNAFAVPVCAVDVEKSNEHRNTPEGLAHLDTLISENQIGQIVNLSQFFNSVLWHIINGGTGFDDVTNLESIYNKICSLAVLSGMEIDKAKRTYAVNANKIIRELTEEKKKIVEKIGYQEFLSFLVGGGNLSGPTEGGKVFISLETPMNRIYEKAKENSIRAPKTGKYRTLVSMCCFDNVKKGNNDYKNVQEILECVKECQKFLDSQNNRYSVLRNDEIFDTREEQTKEVQKCFDQVSKKLKNGHILKLLLEKLDHIDTDDKEELKSCRSLLFGALCLDKNQRFYTMVENNMKEAMRELIPTGTNEGKHMIYDMYFNEVEKRSVVNAE